MFLERVATLLLQVPQAPQLPTTQSTHRSRCSSCGHATPKAEAGTVSLNDEPKLLSAQSQSGVLKDEPVEAPEPYFPTLSEGWLDDNTVEPHYSRP